MNKKILTLSLIIFLFGKLFSQNNETFSEKTEIIIQTEAMSILKKYEASINNIGKNALNNHEEAKSNAESLIKLFVTREVSVYNDLDPEKSLSEVYEIETYANNILLWYKKGITVELKYNLAKVWSIQYHNNDIYTIDISIPKKTTGTYLDGSKYENTGSLDFSIAFTYKSNTTPTNFKIARIKESNSNQGIDITDLNNLNSIELSELELKHINNSVNAVLKDFENYQTMIASDKELESDKAFYKKRLLSAFENKKVLVYNDIQGSYKGELIAAEDYLQLFWDANNNQNTITSFDFENAQYSNVIKEKENQFFTFVYIDKITKTSKTQKTEKLIYKIDFSKNKDSYTKFKIAHINSFENKAKTDNVMRNQKLQGLSTNTRKGFTIGLSISNGMHSIISKDIASLTKDENIYTWESKTAPTSLSASALLSYYFNDKIGVQSGVCYSMYKTSYSIHDSFVDEKTKIKSIIGDIYYNPALEASFDSTISMSTVEIPLEVLFHSSNPGSFGFFGSCGISIAFPFITKGESVGSLTKNGIIVNPPSYFTLPTIENKYVDGYERTGTGSSEELSQISGPSVNINASFGVEYYINYFTSVSAGFYFSYGLNDIEKNTKETQTFLYQSLQHDRTFLRKQGIFIGVKYKL